MLKKIFGKRNEKSEGAAADAAPVAAPSVEAAEEEYVSTRDRLLQERYEINGKLHKIAVIGPKQMALLPKGAMDFAKRVRGQLGLLKGFGVKAEGPDVVLDFGEEFGKIFEDNLPKMIGLAVIPEGEEHWTQTLQLQTAKDVWDGNLDVEIMMRIGDDFFACYPLAKQLVMRYITPLLSWIPNIATWLTEMMTSTKAILSDFAVVSQTGTWEDFKAYLELKRQSSQESSSAGPTTSESTGNDRP